MKKRYSFLILLFFSISCKEAYNVPTSSPPTGFLVVEGFINSDGGATTITLTRTTKLYDSADIIYEHNAQLNIEGENNESFPMSESTTGIYVSDALALNNNEKYRLHIKTSNGKEYLSDFSTLKHTPPIDSISWSRENGGVQMYINAHDDLNATKYYQWKYEETWEFHSTYVGSLKYILDSSNYTPVAVDYKLPSREVDTTIFKCWKTVNSSSITLGSTEKLSRDLVFLPLIYIEPASIKLSVLYSVNLRQYALSHEAYNFLQKMKKNTEQLGSIFDAQPSDLQGNIHCVTDPTETVVGFVETTQEQQKRLFISKSQVPDWKYYSYCQSLEVVNQKDSILKYATGLVPTLPGHISPFGNIETFYATELRCLDCTLAGTNIRPSFWP